MMKSHGPALRKERVILARCPDCNGRAAIKGVFYELPCGRCNASGWLSAVTGEPLPLEELVTQLGLRVHELEQQVDRQRPPRTTGPSEQYETNNRRGAGGTNYTGD
ncbi:hypothetical protein JRG49_09565 [Pseudomonas fulva]|uniref:hypothetical protein n=1 Tax=Pseudomonas TaxID=286 RepID=UPI0019D064D8|nr:MULTISPECIES: hypothetical protein [Pseudomonas]MBN6791481.1 hypothetical protein [Pseudomonas fulva]MBN6795702.1 hypothetical protein [Pseudomonas fulva]MBN6857264.1 hypothetical protein [Pseudomonas fulva]MBN6874025.1 hypothetical protein [Pseudomonas fulva]MBN6878462.1 hypothetical protein [Pseudomonas fulva]